jgi:hypothetical protein
MIKMNLETIELAKGGKQTKNSKAAIKVTTIAT